MADSMSGSEIVDSSNVRPAGVESMLGRAGSKKRPLRYWVNPTQWYSGAPSGSVLKAIAWD